MGTLIRVLRVIKANLSYPCMQARTYQYYYVKGPLALLRWEGNDSVVAIHVLGTYIYVKVA